jgi:arsenate reductase (thioredoxin)
MTQPPDSNAPDDRPEILFVCVHNAGRSQMAAALMHSLGTGRVHVRSAGTEPGDRINPAVIEAMREVGLDLSQEFPKPLTDEAVRAADVVITMGCGDACPIYPGKRYLDWELDDPAGQPIEVVRRIREGIRTCVQTLLHELEAGGQTGHPGPSSSAEHLFTQPAGTSEDR